MTHSPADTNRTPDVVRPQWVHSRISPLGWVLLAIIAAYQVALRPLLVGTCKFHPHCSAYAAEAIRRHGARRGGGLAFRRILRCRPGTVGGIDPVP